MSKLEFDQLVDQLPKLSQGQRSTLLDRLKVLQSINSDAKTSTPGKRDIGSRVLTILCTMLRDLGVEHPSLSMLQKNSQYPAFARKLPSVMEFIAGVGSSRIAQDALLKIALELLYWDIVNISGEAVSSFTIMSQIHRVPAVVNKSFPGYSSSGLLKFIVRAA